MIREEKEGKKFLDQRSLLPKYIYLHEGKTYLDPRKLCEKLGLSFEYVRKNFTKGKSGQFVRKFNIIKVTDGKKVVYKNGKFVIDLEKFSKQFHLSKKDVLKAINQNGSYQKIITINRTSQYDFILSYVVDGKRYPAEII